MQEHLFGKTFRMWEQLELHYLQLSDPGRVEVDTLKVHRVLTTNEEDNLEFSLLMIANSNCLSSPIFWFDG